MLSRFSSRTESLAAYFPSLCLRQWPAYALFWHRRSQEQAFTTEVFILALRERESREIQQRDGALKCFVRALTDGTETVSSPWQANGKEADGEVKLFRREKMRVEGNAMARFNVQSENIKDEAPDFIRARESFWKHVSRSSASSPGIRDLPTKPSKREEGTNAYKNEESASDTCKEAKLLSARSVEVHAVLIKRRLTRTFLCQLQEKIDFLHTAAVPVTQIKKLLKKRAFLSASPEKLVTVVKLLTEKFESKSIAFEVLVVNAGILERPLEMLKQKMHILSRFDVDRKTCIKLGTTQGLWTLRVKNYEEKLHFFEELGMDAQARSNTLYRWPQVLKCTESSLRSTMEGLERIGIFGPNLLKFVELCPTVFYAAYGKSLEATLKLFQDWGFSLNEVIRALRQLPKYRAQHLESQFKFLRDQGLPHDDVIWIIRRLPSVLANTNKDLKAKVDFLRQVNRDIAEVSKFPAYLAFSLEDRIIPRFKALEAVSLRKKPALSSILSGNISVFKRRFDIPDSVKCI